MSNAPQKIIGPNAEATIAETILVGLKVPQSHRPGVLRLAGYLAARLEMATPRLEAAMAVAELCRRSFAAPGKQVDPPEELLFAACQGEGGGNREALWIHCLATLMATDTGNACGNSGDGRTIVLLSLAAWTLIARRTRTAYEERQAAVAPPPTGPPN